MMDKINIGKIVNAVGLKGELKVFHYTDYKERFEELSNIFLEENECKIEKVRYMKDMVILKLEGVDDRNAAEKLKDKMLYITEKDVRVLPEDTYYIRDLIGVKVFDNNENYLGELSYVYQNTAQDVYEITKEDKSKFLLPAVGEFILNIDIKSKTMTVKLIDGLM